MEMVCIKKSKNTGKGQRVVTVYKTTNAVLSLLFWFIQDSAGPFIQAYNTHHTTYLQGKRLLFLSYSFGKELRFLSLLGNINGGRLVFA